MKSPHFTIGIEEEYQIINPETRELTSYMQEMLDEGRLVLQDQIKPEFLRSQGLFVREAETELLVMPRERGLDVDTPLDLALCECLLRAKGSD